MSLVNSPPPVDAGRRGLKTWWRRVSLAVCTGFGVSVLINLYLIVSASPAIYDDVRRLPEREVGVLMGTDLLRPDGSTNIHFVHRTAAAAEAFHAGKVRRLVISGNPDNRGFNEVSEMQQALLRQGVPQPAITLDFEGTRTWHTTRRLRSVHHVDQVTVITDTFHAPRALFLCRQCGVDAVALCLGEEPLGAWFVRHRVREFLARVKAVGDVLAAALRGGP